MKIFSHVCNKWVGCVVSEVEPLFGRMLQGVVQSSCAVENNMRIAIGLKEDTVVVPFYYNSIGRPWRNGAAAVGLWLMQLFPVDRSENSALTERSYINQQAEVLLDTYGNNIFRCAYSYLHNRSDAEEILQETLIQFLKTCPKLENAEHQRAWLLRVAANLSKNKLRYEARRRTDELSEELVAQEQEDLSFVWEAVKALPDHLREVIHLYYYEGYSTVDIAEILSSKEATVRSNLSRGRSKLKQVLKEGYDFEEAISSGDGASDHR